jgi:VWFA-related protein
MGATLSFAQDAPSSVRIASIEAAPGARVHVLVSALDGEGRILKDLGKANFHVTVDGRDLDDYTVERAARGSSPLSVVLAIDVSGSMKGAPITTARRAADALLDRLDPQDFASILVFGSGVRTLVEFTNDRSRLHEALRNLEASDNRTLLYQSLNDSLDLAAGAPTNRVAVVILTDGKDEGSPITIDDVVTKAGIKGVPVYALGYGATADIAVLRRIATVAGGVFYDAPRPEDLSAAYAAIVEHLKNDYLLAFSAPAGVGEFRVLITVDRRGQKATASRQFLIDQKPAQATGDSIPSIPQPSQLDTGSKNLLVLGGGAFVLLFVVGWMGLRYKRRHNPELALTMVPPRVWLEVVKGADAGQKFLLFDREAIIGRASGDGLISLKSDPLVGREHARIWPNDRGQYVIEDLRSKNGVSVGGVKIADLVTLQPNDRIEIGLSELLFIDNR